jgi:hypothetical protein
MRRKEMPLCIYCGVRRGKENEHVISKGFYSSPPKKAITVPSCGNCNRGRGDGRLRPLSLDEEYMRTVLCMTEGAANHPVVNALLEGSITRSFRRRPRGLRSHLVRGTRYTERKGTDSLFQSLL